MTALAVSPPLSGREIYRDVLAGWLPDDQRLVCLDSDTGLFTGVDFGAAADRYVNLGIAEQNLMGVAAGLAASGYVPYVNTMAAFAGARALESVKLDIALSGLPVRIVATHGGLSAGNLGPTHHALEDIATMRVLPNMTVLVPADAAMTAELLRQSRDLPGPVYVRLGRGATPDLPAGVPPVTLGTAQRLRDGRDAVIAACGPYPVLAALRAADHLSADGIEAAVLNIHTVKPLDVAALLDAVGCAGALVTVEEHWRAGGLGSAIAEALTDELPVRVAKVAVADTFAAVAGTQQTLLERYGITADAVAAKVRQVLADPASSLHRSPPELPRTRGVAGASTPVAEASQPVV